MEGQVTYDSGPILPLSGVEPRGIAELRDRMGAATPACDDGPGGRGKVKRDQFAAGRPGWGGDGQANRSKEIVMRKLIILFAGLAIVHGQCAWLAYSADHAESGARTSTPGQGGPEKKITAVGTVEPEAVVDVGAQVAGTITSFGADPHGDGKPIDYGSSVEAGTVLAQIDSTLYAARVEQQRAGCSRAEAELTKARIGLEHAQVEWQDIQEQRKSGTISSSYYHLADFNQKTAKASIAVAEATLAENKAALKQAEIELGYTTIRSPVKGVIIDRRANVGQTVAGTLNSASLFLVADIEKLQVWANVKEADIGQIHPRQRVRFTVDAYPGKVFEGEVKQIRLNATMFQNAVAYTVVVTVSGATDKLLPYMTANLEFEKEPK